METTTAIQRAAQAVARARRAYRELERQTPLRLRWRITPIQAHVDRISYRLSLAVGTIKRYEQPKAEYEGQDGEVTSNEDA